MLNFGFFAGLRGGFPQAAARSWSVRDMLQYEEGFEQGRSIREALEAI